MQSAPAEVTDAAPPPQPSGMQGKPSSGDDSKDGHGHRGPRVWLFAVALATVLAMILAVRFRDKPANPSNPPSSNLAGPGYNLRLKGTTEAVRSSSILAPVLAVQQMSTLTITRLTTAGSHVKRGDLLVEFDRQAQMRDFVDKQAEYGKLLDQVATEQAKESAARAADETALKQAEDALQTAELEIQKSEIVSRIDAEKNQEKLEEAKATFDQLRETFDLKRKAGLAAVRILEIQRDRAEQTMVHARANADLMKIHSPIDGVVVLDSIWKQGTMGMVQEGDQVEPGVAFMQVVDPSAMQVRVLANQEDFLSLQIGQTANVKLDAYPELTFAAQLDERAPVGQAGSFSDKLRTFVVIFSIQGNDPRLMPDLSAAVDVDVTSQGRAGSGY